MSFRNTKTPLKPTTAAKWLRCQCDRTPKVARWSITLKEN